LPCAEDGGERAGFQIYLSRCARRRPRRLTEPETCPNIPDMSEIIYPRSPRETMCGWPYLPRFVDKIRLRLAGELHSDYQENFTKGFDGQWLKAAGVTAEQMVEVVKNSMTDGQVCDWVRQNVKKTDAEKAAFRDFVFNRGTEGGEVTARLNMRKEQSGFSHRDDIKTFVDYIDADEKRI
jgi:Domain of unknown function (DUF5069)